MPKASKTIAADVQQPAPAADVQQPAPAADVQQPAPAADVQQPAPAADVQQPAHLALETKDVGHELVDHTPEQLVDKVAAIELLADGAKLKDVIHKMNEVIEAMAKMTAATKAGTTRDRGPDSTRDMVEDDARRILLGDLALLHHKDAASKLGLSYGQIYSSRKGFTFKNVFKEWRDAEAAKAIEAAKAAQLASDLAIKNAGKRGH